jgi:hypothetical protein
MMSRIRFRLFNSLTGVPLSPAGAAEPFPGCLPI